MHHKRLHATVILLAAVAMVFTAVGVWSQMPDDPPAEGDGTEAAPGSGEAAPEAPCKEGPGRTYSIYISVEEAEPPVLVVDPDPAPRPNKEVQQCDIVVFNNNTGQTITLDFNPDGGEGSPFFGESLVTIPAGEGGEAGQKALEVQANPEQITVYQYTVTVGDLERSPTIRVRPRDEND